MTPVTFDGAPGTVAGVTALDDEDGLDGPMALIATTLNV